MVLYVVTEPDPAPGEDFVFTVPGNYLYDVTGITATLTTGGGIPTVAHDVSGNGHNGTFSTFPIPHLVPPGLIPAGGDAALDCSAGTNGQTARTYVDLGAPAIDYTAPFTIEAWVAGHGGTFPQILVFFTAQNVAGGDDLRFSVGLGGALHCDQNGGISADTAILAGMLDGNGHHVAFVYDGTAVQCYFDGLPVTTTNSGMPFTAAIPDQSWIGADDGTRSCKGLVDELAIYSTDLSAGRVAAHYAAGAVSFAAYAAAVLVDTPYSYYHLDDTGGGGRQPSLLVTNGTTDLELIPTGFPAVSTDGPYQYSWQPRLNADTQSTDGTLTTVAIPELILPAGYTVGTRTLDLQSTDQWSKVTLWWDDRYQAAFDPFAQYEFPGGIRLRYHRQGT